METFPSTYIFFAILHIKCIILSSYSDFSNIFAKKMDTAIQHKQKTPFYIQFCSKNGVLPSTLTFYFHFCKKNGIKFLTLHFYCNFALYTDIFSFPYIFFAILHIKCFPFLIISIFHNTFAK